MLLCFVVVMMTGCATKLDFSLTRDPGEPPLFHRIDARVGMSFPANVRTKTWTYRFMDQETARVSLGEQGVARFRQVFGAMFAHVEDLPENLPWRRRLAEIDGVVELDRADLDVTVDHLDHPVDVKLEYRACLYEPTGVEIKCWAVTASQSLVGPSHGLLTPNYERVKPGTEMAARDAIARLMVEIERDPAVSAWATRIARSREHK